MQIRLAIHEILADKAFIVTDGLIYLQILKLQVQVSLYY